MGRCQVRKIQTRNTLWEFMRLAALPASRGEGGGVPTLCGARTPWRGTCAIAPRGQTAGQEGWD